MILKNSLLVVRDLERATAFYRELFGLEVTADLGGNRILMQGLVLQEQALWEETLGKKIQFGGCDTELYFEDSRMDVFLEKLEAGYPGTEILTPCTELPWGQRMIRICDPDGHAVEVRETMESTERRLRKKAMTDEKISARTGVPVDGGTNSI